jgi:hypothetical protein
MADRVLPGPADNSACIREAVCIHTRKIFDSCRDKDCIEDLRVYPCKCSKAVIENALSVRPRSAKLLYVCVKTEEIPFNRGYYTVDVTYFYRIVGEAFPGAHEVTGLAVFEKRAVLFGGEGNVKLFSSNDCLPMCPSKNPTATVEAVDPIALGMKLVDVGCASGGPELIPQIPIGILEAMGEEVVLVPDCRLWYVPLGQFSIIRMERDSQILIPMYNYCFPDKECEGGTEDDPCTLFSRIRFPMEEFFPTARHGVKNDSPFARKKEPRGSFFYRACAFYLERLPLKGAPRSGEGCLLTTDNPPSRYARQLLSKGAQLVKNYVF